MDYNPVYFFYSRAILQKSFAEQAREAIITSGAIHTAPPWWDSRESQSLGLGIQELTHN